MRIFSAFDGISCGMVALKKMGIHVDEYIASEIDKHAIKVSSNNHPGITHIGDINNVDFSKYTHIDMLIGGSPCQSLSRIRSDRTHLSGKSGIFFKFVEAKNIIKPKWFLLENVASMSDASRDIISECMGVSPIMIDSACFSAQSRQRYYWTNIPVDISKAPNHDYVLSDIMERGVDEKYYYDNKFHDVDLSKRVCAKLDFDFNAHDHVCRVYNPLFKAPTISCDGAGGNLQKKVMDNGRVRKLTPVEYERLQGLPDDYTLGVSDSQRYNVCGNGWNIPTIEFILSFLPKEYINVDDRINQDALEYLLAHGLEIPSRDEVIPGNAAWELRDRLNFSRPYVVSDFERKYVIPDL